MRGTQLPLLNLSTILFRRLFLPRGAPLAKDIRGRARFTPNLMQFFLALNRILQVWVYLVLFLRSRIVRPCLRSDTATSPLPRPVGTAA